MIKLNQKIKPYGEIISFNAFSIIKIKEKFIVKFYDKNVIVLDSGVVYLTGPGQKMWRFLEIHCFAPAPGRPFEGPPPWDYLVFVTGSAQELARMIGIGYGELRKVINGTRKLSKASRIILEQFKEQCGANNLKRMVKDE